MTFTALTWDLVGEATLPSVLMRTFRGRVGGSFGKQQQQFCPRGQEWVSVPARHVLDGQCVSVKVPTTGDNMGRASQFRLFQGRAAEGFTFGTKQYVIAASVFL